MLYLQSTCDDQKPVYKYLASKKPEQKPQRFKFILLEGHKTPPPNFLSVSDVGLVSQGPRAVSL